MKTTTAAFMTMVGIALWGLIEGCAAPDYDPLPSEEVAAGEREQAQQFEDVLHEPECFTDSPLSQREFFRAIAVVYPTGGGRPCTGFALGTRGCFVTHDACESDRGAAAPTAVFDRYRTGCHAAAAPVTTGTGYQLGNLVARTRGAAVYRLPPEAAAWGHLDMPTFSLPPGASLNLYQAAWDGADVTTKVATHFTCRFAGQDGVNFLHTCTTLGSTDPLVHEEPFGGPIVDGAWKSVRAFHRFSFNTPGTPSVATPIGDLEANEFFRNACL